MPASSIAYDIDLPEESEVEDIVADEDPVEENDQKADQDPDQDEIVKEKDDTNIVIESLNDVNSNIVDVDEKVNDVSQNVKDVADAVAEGNNLLKDMNDRQQEEEEISDIDVLNMIHEDMQKIMISLWALFGLLLGTRLIKGMFGNG